MKIKLTMLLLILSILIFKSCTVNTKNESPLEIIAFCDMTTSLDTISIKKLARDVRNMITKVPYGTVINIYPINDNTFTDKIFTIPYRNIDKRSKKQKREEMETRKSEGEKIEKIIIDNYTKMNKDSSSEYKSCIISSLETVYDIVKTNGNKDNIHVVFFSDMIEQCEISIADKMYMCSNKLNPKKEDLIQQVKEKYIPNFNIKKLIGNRVTVIVSTNLKKHVRCLQESERKAVWKEVFKKVGYSAEDFESFHFNQNSRDDWSTLGQNPNVK
ncbi:MAG: hypothetical protein AB8B65_11675 [Kordia sp.]|uniref:hypothetical protein n=1 Tax=Kordia sp. TaxID=1965332 RepID=UPI00385C28C5